MTLHMAITFFIAIKAQLHMREVDILQLLEEKEMSRNTLRKNNI